MHFRVLGIVCEKLKGYHKDTLGYNQHERYGDLFKLRHKLFAAIIAVPAARTKLEPIRDTVI